MAGDLNAKLAEPEGTQWSEAITDKLAALRLENMGLHFLPQRKTWLQYRYTWSIRRDEQEFRSQTDYILRKYCRLFQDMAVRDPRQYLDHYIVLGCMTGEPVKELTDYFRKARRFPLWPICCDLASASDKLFLYIKTQIPNPSLRERVRRAWISDETWATMDA